MTRTFKEIEIEGKRAYVLFDTGSMRSYIRNEFASEVKRRIEPFHVGLGGRVYNCLLYTSPSPRDRTRSRMPSSA